MRIIVTSDSHRLSSFLIKVVEKHLDDADLFINLGDGYSDVENVQELYPKVKFECVTGNCDFTNNLPETKIITAGKKRILLTHGHKFDVKYTLEKLMHTANLEKVDICLFGHTHEPYCEYNDGIYYLNPGAVMSFSYGIIDITDAGIVTINAKI